MYQVLFNPFSGNGQGEAVSKKLPLFFPESALHYHKMTEIKDYPTLFSAFAPDDIIILVGGDGTLNRFINDLQARFPVQELYYYAGSSGNDFYKDVKDSAEFVSEQRDESGKDITVSFDRPVALQVDGETVLGITEYHAYC